MKCVRCNPESYGPVAERKVVMFCATHSSKLSDAKGLTNDEIREINKDFRLREIQREEFNAI